jgi:hypothetical protein
MVSPISNNQKRISRNDDLLAEFWQMEKRSVMNGQRIRRIRIWLVTSLYLLACVLPFMATPAAPAQIPAETIIVQTAAAAQTQTAIYLPTVTLTPSPTYTPIPTITPTPTPTFILLVLTTATSTSTATPTVTFVLTQAGTASSEEGSTGKSKKGKDDDGEGKPSYASVIDKEWACTVEQKSPRNNTVIGRGTHFSAALLLLNRGLKTWPNNSVDFIYRGGLRNEGRARFDLTSTVIPGGSITLYLTFIAPETPGAYRSLWTLRVGRRTYFCKMGINFFVKFSLN